LKSPHSAPKPEPWSYRDNPFEIAKLADEAGFLAAAHPARKTYVTPSSN
jgi:hypothetical protein